MPFWPWMHAPKRMQNNQENESLTLYTQLLDRNGHWIGVADAKAGVVLGFVMASFPLLVAPAFPAVQKLIKAIPANALWWGYLPVAGLIMLIIVFVVAALFTLVQVVLTLIPRLTRKGKPNIIFFGDIASQDYHHWHQRVLALDSHQFADQVLEQVYTTACIAHCKHQHIRQAIRALIITILFGFVVGLFSLILG